MSTKDLTVASNITSESHHRYIVRNRIIAEFLSTKHGRTQRDYQKRLQKFFKWSNTKAIEQLTPLHMSEYKNFLIKQKLAPNTINTYLAALRSFFAWCYSGEVGYMDHNPAMNLSNVPLGNLDAVDKAPMLETHELKALLGQTTKDSMQAYGHRVAFLMMFNLGLRVFELTNIRLRDIVLDAEYPYVNIMGKGSKPRQVAINDVLKRELKGYLGLLPNDFTLDAYLIQSTYYRTGKINNKAPTTKHIRDLFNRYGKKAGLATPIKTHSARVTAINILLDQDVPLRDVANYVGHSDTNTTRGYDRKSLKKSSSISRLLDVS